MNTPNLPLGSQKYNSNSSLNFINIKLPSQTRFTYAPTDDFPSIKPAINTLLKEANINGEEERWGWQYFDTRKGVRIFKKQNLNASPQISIRGSTLIPGRPSKVLEVLTSRSSTSWDVMCKERNSLEKVDDFTEVHHSIYEAHTCLIRIPRDLTYVVRWYETDNGGYILAASNVVHKLAPEKEGSVRMKLHPSGWIITPVDSSACFERYHSAISANSPICEVTFILQLDVRLSYFPTVFINGIVVNQAMNVHRLRQLVKSELLQHQEKIKLQDVKFRELSESFQSDEQLIAYLMKKMQQTNPTVLKKAIESFSKGNTVVQEVVHEIVDFDVGTPTQELNYERGRSRSNSLSENITYGSFAASGNREMEDAHLCMRIVDEKSGLNCLIFAVFDGHFGPIAANFCKESLHSRFVASYAELKDPFKALEKTFQVLESEFLAEAEKIQTEAGTTALIAVLMGNRLIIGNIGDCEAVLYRASKPHLLNEVHSGARNEKEVARVKKAGGTIHSNAKLSHPLWNPNIISLGVTRAIGDLYFKVKKYTDNKVTGLISAPSISETTVSASDDFMVLASDGLWTVLKHQEVVNFVSEKFAQKIDAENIAKQLVELGLSKGANDNITAILVNFNVK